MIKVNKIELETAEFFDPDGNSLGKLNLYEFNDLRIQIKNLKLSGYYGVFNGIKIKIDRFGGCSQWPKGFFDRIDSQLEALLEW